MAKQKSKMNWEKRVVVISYEKQDDQIFTKTKKFISDNKCENEDRNLEIIFYEKFENQNYAKPDFETLRKQELNKDCLKVSDSD